MAQKMFNTYIAQIQKYPLLTAEEELALADQIQNGDSAAKQRLIQSNLRLVVSIAKKYKNTSIPLLDIIQEGNLGLILAAERYKASFKTRFSTYAYLWITQSILRFIRNRKSLIIVPHRKENMIRKLNAAREYLFNQHGHEAGVEELADFLGVSTEEVKDALRFSYTIASLETEITSESDSEVKDVLPDTTYSPEEEMLRDTERHEIIKLFRILSPAEQSVLYYRYNLGYDEKTKTLRQLGEMLGVSSETVRQMEMRAIRRLRIAVSGQNRSFA